MADLTKEELHNRIINNTESKEFHEKNKEKFPGLYEKDNNYDPAADIDDEYEDEIYNEENSILNELESFAESINKKTLPKVTLMDGYHAVAVANEIMDQMK